MPLAAALAALGLPGRPLASLGSYVSAFADVWPLFAISAFLLWRSWPKNGRRTRGGGSLVIAAIGILIAWLLADTVL